MNLMVMVPTRGRRVQCERLLESFRENTDNADIAFILDQDDEETYKDMEWGDALAGVLTPRESLSGKLNQTAAAFTGLYDVLMFVADDYTFDTPHWDTLMLDILEDMGGTGMVFPENQHRPLPAIVMISSDIIRELGWFAQPQLKHYCLDEVWNFLGRRADLIRKARDVVVKHHHYMVDPFQPRDETYSVTEEAYAQQDVAKFREWMGTEGPGMAARLRRKFNPDTRWIRERTA